MRTLVILKLALPLAALALLSAAASAVTLEPPPVWTDGHLIGPARQAAELVKATFTYDANTRKLKLALSGKSVEMTVGSKTAKINGETVTLPVAPKVLNGTTYVPLKNLFIGLGLEVKPDGSTAWILCTGKLCLRLEVPPKPEQKAPLPFSRRPPLPALPCRGRAPVATRGGFPWKSALGSP